MSKPLIIDYYTDVLCVWGWIAQSRIEQLTAQFGDKIILRYRYMDLFGDTKTKIDKQWGTRGGFNGFAQYVVKSVVPFDGVDVNPNIWSEVKPTTSANVHLVLKAIALVASEAAASQFALTVRKAFFVDSLDISDLMVLQRLMVTQGLDTDAVNAVINDGQAIAALMGDYQSAKQKQLQGSPSWILDGGRQTLFGNVSYPVLEANVASLLSLTED